MIKAKTQRLNLKDDFEKYHNYYNQLVSAYIKKEIGYDNFFDKKTEWAMGKAKLFEDTITFKKGYSEIEIENYGMTEFYHTVAFNYYQRGVRYDRDVIRMPIIIDGTQKAWVGLCHDTGNIATNR